MKRMSILLVLLMLLAGCGSLPETPNSPTEITGPSETVDLMPGASPETSALALYIYDGQSVTRQFLFDERKMEDALKDFRSADVQPVTLNPADLKAPYYGLEIGGKDGFSVCGLWSQGYFIMGDGSAYRFDYDFTALEQYFDGDVPDTFSDSAYLPCAEYAARTADGWNTDFLIPAEEPAGEKGISMKLVSLEEKNVNVRYVNHSGSEWSYGLYAELHAQVDGEWYTLPTVGDYVVISIAKLVPAGKDVEESYSLQPWGDLFPGTYRLVGNGLSAEFSVE